MQTHKRMQVALGAAAALFTGEKGWLRATSRGSQATREGIRQVRRTAIVGLGLGVWMLVAVAPVAAVGTSYSGSLAPPNTASDAVSGDVIQLNGAGTFDTSGSISWKGTFKHFDSAGNVVARGRYQATEFVTFDAFGGPSPGFQGGVLEFEATFFPAGQDPVENVTVIVTCDVFAPTPTTEGITVSFPGGPDFSQSTGGFNLFHLSSS